MRVLFNASTLAMGGGVQVATELLHQIEQARGDGGPNWVVAVSSPVKQAIESRAIDAGSLHHFGESPSRSRRARRRILQIEAESKVDCVITLFGPAYVRFRSPHLLGIADGWVTHSDRLAFGSLARAGEKLRMLATVFYKGLWLRQADAWVVESELARQGASKRLRIPRERISVIPNTCGAHYLSFPFREPVAFASDTVRILVLAASYPHKNLEIIPEVAAALRDSMPAGNFEFVVTLPEKDARWRSIHERALELGLERHVCNVGPVTVGQGPQLWDSCDICFLPTLLETFTAVYPEAMAAGRPIVTTDRPFARSICGAAAAYFTPRDPQSAAVEILQVIESSTLRRSLIARGRSMLERFQQPGDRLKSITAILNSLHGQSASS